MANITMERVRDLRVAFETALQLEGYHLDCAALALWALTSSGDPETVVARMFAHFEIPDGEYQAAMVAAVRAANAS